LPIIGDWKHADKHSTVSGMQSIKVLGLTEIDLKQPRTTGDLETTLTSVLRGRMLSGKPTVITLKTPSWFCDTSSGCEINDLVHTAHDEDDAMVIRMRINGENK
jgi:hypothetical protein